MTGFFRNWRFSGNGFFIKRASFASSTRERSVFIASSLTAGSVQRVGGSSLVGGAEYFSQ